ncbi:MAG: carbon starvation CstA family protein [Alphaproteobacteria bacterium]
MLAVALILGTIVFFFFGYRLYGGLIDRKIVMPTDEVTPAHLHQDSPDFEPAKPPILFGHHFASIAGAGPIIGPIAALAIYGWVAVLGWILLGAVFIGAVHDYLTLMFSTRHDGASIAEIAGRTMGARAKAIFGLFLYITLTLIIAVFGVAGAKTMTVQPSMVIPTFMVILIAVLFGLAIHRWKVRLVPATIVAVALNITFIVVGYHVPVNIAEFWADLDPLQAQANAQTVWFIVLMIYAGVASILPVEMLLQPRDYISTFNLYGALGLGIAGLIYVQPQINAPAFTSFTPDKGPLWPMLFILVACGAVSGFHSLVSGGTTSKQLARERDGKPIAFGGMLLEGVLAAMTLLLVACAFHWKMPEGVPAESVMLFSDTYNQGWIVVFGHGFGKIVADMLPALGMGLAALLGMMTIKTFILTTLDTATRITRFLVQEAGGPLARLQNKYLALMVALVPAFLFGITNSWKAIWPMFGASNQLVASLALFVISAYLIGVRRPSIYTIVPAIFMLLTTTAALVWQAKVFFFGEEINWALGITSVVLIILAFFLAVEGAQALLRKRRAA